MADGLLGGGEPHEEVGNAADLDVVDPLVMQSPVITDVDKLDQGGQGGGGPATTPTGPGPVAESAHRDLDPEKEVMEMPYKYGWRRDGTYGPLGGSYNSTDNALILAAQAAGMRLEDMSYGTGGDYEGNAYLHGAMEAETPAQVPTPAWEGYKKQVIPHGANPYAGKGRM